ncbi:MAG: hypothetical protein Q7T50_05605 [Candidatus Magasanikbacteria bacterium]|nr:hypothetical protein [Candidatus Magasanikbacteria bacterium]
MKKIVCINVYGGNLPLYVSEHLLNVSIGMFQNKVEHAKIEGATYGGRITTAFRSVSLGGVSGLEFSADLEIEIEGHSRRTNVKYLVEPSILIEGYANFKLSQMTAWEFLVNVLSKTPSRAEGKMGRTFH